MGYEGGLGGRFLCFRPCEEKWLKMRMRKREDSEEMTKNKKEFGSMKMEIGKIDWFDGLICKACLFLYIEPVARRQPEGRIKVGGNFKG